MTIVTIQDVAKHAGVSMKTVSRVVNRDANVRQQTREKVEQSINSLDYKPNRFARSLAGNKSYLLGLLYDNISASYVLSAQEGSLQKCESEGYSLLIHPCNFHSPELADDILKLARQSGIDGLILTPPLSDKTELLESLDAKGIPYVRVSPGRPHHSDFVVSNEKEAVYELISRLISDGHQDIGFIGGNPDHGASQWRLEVFKKAMQDANIKVDQNLILEGDFSFESGERCGLELLSRNKRPTAIFASNDYMAAGVMKACHLLDLRIPEDISIAGFDDAPVASQIWPSMTTIRQPVRRILSHATQLLINRINGKEDKNEEANLQCAIIIRHTTRAI